MIPPKTRSQSETWGTPDAMFAELNAEFGFTLDPCATPDSAKCRKFYTPQDDGLTQDWSKEIVFMNPPYSMRALYAWMGKALEESRRGATVVCLVPVKSEQPWWHDFAMKGEIRFVRGRVYFKGARYNAPFPVAIVIFRPAPSTAVLSGESVSKQGT